MLFSWKNDLYQESFHWSFFSFSETLRTHCMHFLQSGFNDFFLLFWGVIEMNS